MMESIKWSDGRLQLIDQRLLPHEEKWITCQSVEDVAEAIRSMVVRGAPAIAIAGAYGMAMAVAQGKERALAQQQLLSLTPNCSQPALGA